MHTPCAASCFRTSPIIVTYGGHQCLGVLGQCLLLQGRTGFLRGGESEVAWGIYVFTQIHSTHGGGRRSYKKLPNFVPREAEDASTFQHCPTRCSSKRGGFTTTLRERIRNTSSIYTHTHTYILPLYCRIISDAMLECFRDKTTKRGGGEE